MRRSSSGAIIRNLRPTGCGKWMSMARVAKAADGAESGAALEERRGERRSSCKGRGPGRPTPLPVW